jgi:hypothetical protein
LNLEDEQDAHPEEGGEEELNPISFLDQSGRGGEEMGESEADDDGDEDGEILEGLHGSRRGIEAGIGMEDTTSSVWRTVLPKVG